MKPSILIVEDDPFIALDLQDTFENAGFEVCGPVSSVTSGLKVLEKKRPDVAMLDFNLGTETSLPIAEQLQMINIPFAFLSGQIVSVIKLATDISGIFIAKPYNPDALVSQIKELLPAKGIID